jgi:hypothetical protein
MALIDGIFLGQGIFAEGKVFLRSYPFLGYIFVAV